jgi:hypothetical protein
VKFHLNLQNFMGPGENLCFFSSVGRVIQATAWFFPGAAPEAMALQRLKTHRYDAQSVPEGCAANP